MAELPPTATATTPTNHMPNAGTQTNPGGIENKQFDLTKNQHPVKKKKAAGPNKRLKVKFQEKLLMTDNLSTMIGTGITIAETFSILIEQTEKKQLKEMYQAILDRINSGQTLSNSLREFPIVFNQMFVNMVAIGEKSGTLEDTLKYLAKQMEKEAELRKKVVGAMIYPGLIISMTLFIAVGIVVFIMPKITEIFASLNLDLPLPTVVLIETSNFITGNPVAVLLGTIGGFFLMKKILKSKTFKPIIQGFTLKMPVFGKLFIAMNLARFFQSLHALLAAGVNITKALEIAATLFNNQKYVDTIMAAHAKVEKGSTLDAALTGHEKLFPTMTVKMLNVGERTGNIEATTAHLAHMYEGSVDGITKNLSVLLEPLMLLFMGGLVSGIALAIILPIYQLPNSM